VREEALTAMIVRLPALLRTDPDKTQSKHSAAYRTDDDSFVKNQASYPQRRLRLRETLIPDDEKIAIFRAIYRNL
jgi:hypothetical protein